MRVRSRVVRGTRRSTVAAAVTAAAATVAALAALAAPGGAITGGQADGGQHPEVGGMVLYYPPRDETILNCTGTLVSPTVFLTAAHCGQAGARVEVTFAEVFDPATSPRHAGTFHAHPAYDPAQEFLDDVAVIVLDQAVTGVTPARLPPAGLLDRLRADGTLVQGSQFTAVGYGLLGYSSGPGGMTPVPNASRNYAVGSFNALTPEQLHLSQNPALGDGGTCDGDSGGPNFLGAGAGETDVVVSVTSTGETYCKATNATYRVDTADARSFLGRYVTLP